MDMAHNRKIFYTALLPYTIDGISTATRNNSAFFVSRTSCITKQPQTIIYTSCVVTEGLTILGVRLVRLGSQLELIEIEWSQLKSLEVSRIQVTSYARWSHLKLCEVSWIPEVDQQIINTSVVMCDTWLAVLTYSDFHWLFELFLTFLQAVLWKNESFHHVHKYLGFNIQKCMRIMC